MSSFRGRSPDGETESAADRLHESGPMRARCQTARPLNRDFSRESERPLACPGPLRHRAETNWLGRVDLGHLRGGPGDGVLRPHALDRPGEHVDHDVLRQRLGRLASGRAGIADLAGVQQRLAKYRGLGIFAPERIVGVRAGGRNAERVHRLEVTIELARSM